MSFTIPAPPENLSDAETRDKLLAPLVRKKEGKNIEQLMNELFLHSREVSEENASLRALVRASRKDDEDSMSLIREQREIIERQHATIMQQSRHINQPTGFKWLLSAIVGLASDCFFFLSRLMTKAKEKIHQLSSHTWKWILIKCDVMVRMFRILECRLNEARAYAYRQYRQRFVVA